MDKTSYPILLKQLESLLSDENDLIANLSNTSAFLFQVFNHHWIGFYIVKNNELVLGPFQGPVACTRIAFGKGVCGKAWETKTALVVNNVHEFEGHIACSPHSNSEIVVPILLDNEVMAVLDIDSIEYSAFDQTDLYFFNQVCTLLANKF